MKITDVKVFPVDEDKLKAYATITFDNCFIVRDLKVISGNKGYFIAMPSKKRKDGTFRDVAHPLNSETRKMIEEAVLEVYEKEQLSGAVPSPHGSEAAEVDDTTMEPYTEDETADSEVGGSETGPAENAQADAEEPGPAEPDQPEETGKGAEENPVIEPSDDPEKAFGYEE